MRTAGQGCVGILVVAALAEGQVAFEGGDEEGLAAVG